MSNQNITLMLLFLYQKTAKIYLSLTSDTVKLKKTGTLICIS